MKYRLLVPATVALIAVLFATVAIAGGHSNFDAKLRGEAENPSVDTQAVGHAKLKVSQSGDSIDFKVVVAKIEDITQAHIHCGAEGVNGPIVAFLYGLGPTVTVNGILAQGTITPGALIPRDSSAMCPGGVANFADLIEKIETGGAYVNVHTVANPGGEIRGPVR